MRMYQRAGFRLRPDLAPPPLAVVMTKPRYFAALRVLWQTRSLVRPVKVRPEQQPGGICVGCLPQGTPRAAGHARLGPPSECTPGHVPSDTAADLWHSRGEP